MITVNVTYKPERHIDVKSLTIGDIHAIISNWYFLSLDKDFDRDFGRPEDEDMRAAIREIMIGYMEKDETLNRYCRENVAYWNVNCANKTMYLITLCEKRDNIYKDIYEPKLQIHISVSDAAPESNAHSFTKIGTIESFLEDLEWEGLVKEEFPVQDTTDDWEDYK